MKFVEAFNVHDYVPKWLQNLDRRVYYVFLDIHSCTCQQVSYVVQDHRLVRGIGPSLQLITLLPSCQSRFLLLLIHRDWIWYPVVGHAQRTHHAFQCGRNSYRGNEKLYD